MELWKLMTYVLLPLLVGYIANNERDKADMKRKLNNTLSRNDIGEFIDIKQRAVEVMQQELKEDIQKCNTKLDKIEDLLRGIGGTKGL